MMSGFDSFLLKKKKCFIYLFIYLAALGLSCRIFVAARRIFFVAHRLFIAARRLLSSYGAWAPGHAGPVVAARELSSCGMRL